MLRQAADKGIILGAIDDCRLDLLVAPEELDLLKDMAAYPELLRSAAVDLAPHRIIFYLQDLAGKFHSYYNKHRVLSDDVELS